MNNNLIQNSIAQRQAGTMNTPARHTSGEVDYRHLQVGARPLMPKGRLVKDRDVFGIGAIPKQTKFLIAGLKGEASDHQLGQTNDLLMKTGALGVAGYLATRRALPAKKGMEFVGAATFFATMALWPKLFIQAPVQLMQGFNVNQKWVDSHGRKKDYLRDPQYFSPDIMSPEYINKVGDRMGVSKNMVDRQELITDKMQKTAIQANTLWMLTAGLATPILGALVASQIEEPLNKVLEKAATSKIDKKYANIDELVKQKASKADDKKLNELLNAQTGKKVDSKVFNQILGHLETNDLMLNEKMEKDMKDIIGYKKQDKVADLFDGILKKDVFKKLNITKEALEQKLEDGKVNKDVKLTPESRKSVAKALGKFWTNEEARNKACDAKAGEAGVDFDTAKDLLAEELTAARDEVMSDKNVEAVLSKEQVAKIKDISKIKNEYNARRSILDEFQSHYIGEKENAVVARRWNSSTNKIMKAMGFTTKELQKAGTSSDAARDIFDKKLTDLAKKGNEAKFEKVLGKVVDAVKDFEDSISEKNFGTKGKVNFENHVLNQSTKLFDDSAKKLRDLKANNVADYLAGAAENGLKASAKSNYENVLKDTLNGSKNSMYKFIHVMDVYKKIADGKLQGGNKDLVDKSGVPNIAKRVMLESRMGDHIVKLDIPNPDLYKEVMHSLYNKDNGFSSATSKVLNSKDKHIGETLKGIMDTTAKELGDRLDVFNQESAMNPGGEFWNRSLDAKKGLSGIQARLGETISEVFKGSAEPLYNTKKWVGMFGKAGIALAAVTVIAPAFFGKIKTENNGGAK